MEKHMAKAEKRSGSYSVRVNLIDPNTGKYVQKRVTAPTKRELDVKVAALKTAWHTDSYMDASDTPLAQYLTEWVENSKVKAATRVRRASIVRSHITTDPIGQIPLGKLKRYHVQEFVDRKAKTSSSGTVELIYTVLRRALNRAVILGMMPTSPCTHVELPKRERRPSPVFSEDETRRFIAGTTDDDLHAAWVLMVTVGLRRGEIIGLRWQDIEWDRDTLSVARTQTRDENAHWIIGDSAKSATSQRSIHLPRVCLEALRTHRTRQLERRLILGSAWENSGAVFDNGVGSHLNYPEIINKRFRSILKSLSLPALTPHDLRHTAATNALRRGVPIHVVANMLGHANASITLRVYAHVLADMQQDAASRIDAIFDGPGTQRTG